MNWSLDVSVTLSTLFNRQTGVGNYKFGIEGKDYFSRTVVWGPPTMQFGGIW